MEILCHLFSNGSASVDLFISRKEMDEAMNRIAIVAIRNKVQVLGFSIQDTHVHLLVKGELNNIVNFMKEYQKRTRDSLTRRGSSLTDFSMEMACVNDELYAKRVAAYVICQATKDGKKVMPYDYPWSSASLYFRIIKNDLLWRLDEIGEGKYIQRMGELSMKQQKTLFHVSEKLPAEWEVCDGMILPSSYIDVKGFENIFMTPNCFRTFLGGSAAKDSEISTMMASIAGVNLDENEARAVARNLCLELFAKHEIRSLDIMQRIELGRKLRQRYQMGLSQISRRIYVPENEVRKYIK